MATGLRSSADVAVRRAAQPDGAQAVQAMVDATRAEIGWAQHVCVRGLHLPRDMFGDDYRRNKKRVDAANEIAALPSTTMFLLFVDKMRQTLTFLATI
jgi:hypothetical protein